MKTIKNSMKQIALLFSIILLISSCVTYKATSLTIDELVKTQEKVRVEYKDSKIQRFQNLVLENGTYFGMMKEKLQTVKKPIEVESIKSVRVYDRTKSTIVTIGVPVLLVGIAYFVAKKSISPSINF